MLLDSRPVIYMATRMIKELNVVNSNNICPVKSVAHKICVFIETGRNLMAYLEQRFPRVSLSIYRISFSVYIFSQTHICQLSAVYISSVADLNNKS